MHAITIRSKGFWAVILVGVVLGGCSGETWEWNWDWLRGGDKKTPQQPVAKASRPVGQPPDAQAARTGPEKPGDPRVADVDAKVEQYVRNMSPVAETGYVPNDFNAKIRRQQDPRRRTRIRKTAERATARPASSDAPLPGISPRAANEDATRRPGSTDEPIVRPAVLPRPPTGRDATPVPQRQDVDPAAASPNPISSTPGTAPGEAEAAQAPPGVGDVGTQPRIPSRRGPSTPMDTDAGSAGSARPRASDVIHTAKQPRDERPESTGAGATTPAKPPVLKQIRVSPGPEPAVKTAPPAEAKVGETPAARPAVKTVDTLMQRLAGLESRVRQEPNNLEAQYDWRMTLLANGRPDQALASVDGVDEEIQEMIQAHVRALIAARSSPGRDPAINANHQLEKIEELRNIVRARADLLLPKVVLCTEIDAFGQYTPIEPAEFQAGRKHPILVYVEVDNFHSEKASSGMYRTLLSVRQSLLNKAGEELWTSHDANIEDLARQRRHDFFLALTPPGLPRTLAPGEYVIKVEVEDVLGDKINSNVASFKMVP